MTESQGSLLDGAADAAQAEKAAPVRNVLNDSEKFRLGRYLDKARSVIEGNMRDSLDSLAGKLTHELGFLITPTNLQTALAAAEIAWPSATRADGQIRRLWAELSELKRRIAALEGVDDVASRPESREMA